MKPVVLGLVLGLLAACTVEEPPALTAIEVFRDPSAQIASQTDVTPDRMAGNWVVRQSFATGPQPQSTLVFRLANSGDLFLSETAEFCEGDICGAKETLYLMVPTGPGRWKTERPSMTLPSQEIWVMWMDFDSRTVAIGSPTGEFGWIMDKNATGGGDRITAARDIMDWFGYNTAQLEEVRQ